MPFTSFVLIFAIALYIPVSIGARISLGIVITIFPPDVSTEKSEKTYSEIKLASMVSFEILFISSPNKTIAIFALLAPPNQTRAGKSKMLLKRFEGFFSKRHTALPVS